MGNHIRYRSVNISKKQRVTVKWTVYWEIDYRVAQKSKHKVLSISWPITDRFSKFFHCYILWQICSKVVTKHTTTP